RGTEPRGRRGARPTPHVPPFPFFAGGWPAGRMRLGCAVSGPDDTLTAKVLQVSANCPLPLATGLNGLQGLVIGEGGRPLTRRGAALAATSPRRSGARCLLRLRPRPPNPEGCGNDRETPRPAPAGLGPHARRSRAFRVRGCAPSPITNLAAR